MLHNDIPLPKIFEREYRFCLILWAHEPVKSKELMWLCQEQLGWKPTTTYTVLKRLSERGVLKNENAVIISLVSKEDVQAAKVNEFPGKRLPGSLPAFLKAYFRNHTLLAQDMQDISEILSLSNTGIAK